MPTYEYECEKCGLIFEEFQSITDKPLSVCKTPECKGKVNRLLSGGAGFLFKGSGFYITDYRSDSYKKAAKADTDSSSSSTQSSKKESSPAKSESTPPKNTKKPKSSGE
ncbi:MAG: zinc ribbon domain-containing protein [Chitinivibrionales bacterium]|nr:zinc ribbon domain-containing protein [Chitinivibrionales bacterium]